MAAQIIKFIVKTDKKKVTTPKAYASHYAEVPAALKKISPVVQEALDNVNLPHLNQNLNKPPSTGVPGIQATTKTSTQVNTGTRIKITTEQLTAGLSSPCYEPLDSNEQGMVFEPQQKRILEEIQRKSARLESLIGPRYDYLFRWQVDPFLDFVDIFVNFSYTPKEASLRELFVEEFSEFAWDVSTAVTGFSRRSGGNEYSTKKRKVRSRG